jgi:hypothetical protein
MLTDLLGDILFAIPAIIGVIILLLIGYLIGTFLGKAVNKTVSKMGIEKAFDQTSSGKVFKSAGMDLSSFLGGATKAFIIAVFFIIAVEFLNISGVVGQYLVSLASYLPRLIGGILIIVFGITILAEFLSSFVGKILKAVMPESKAQIADMLKNVLLVGLIAVVLLIALDIMYLGGGLIYPLIIGFLIIGVGISLTDGLLDSITRDHKEFASVAGYAKFVLYSVFLLIGTGAIFSTFSGVTNIIANISWAFAIAFAIILVPIVYTMAKRISGEAK